MSELVRVLIAASEKAANIARIVRSEKELFKLLVEEKTVAEGKNSRFVQDFKTLADVLIQECLRHDISAVFPMMKNNIFGEECNTFTNALGESVTVTVKDSVAETAQLLFTVLDGNQEAARILAEEVHREISADENATSHLSHDFITSYGDVGIWIDPIDATNEYVRGSFEGEAASDSSQNEEMIWSKGLHCVTVLIGAFSITTGQPMIGVVNQPFWKFESSAKRWLGRKFWGVSANNQLVSSLTRYPLSRDPTAKKLVILSASEEDSVRKQLQDKFDFVCSSGAGYKLLCVALGLADVYVLSKPTTHFWDTCGPHAILNSLGGGIISYGKVVETNNTQEPEGNNNNNYHSQDKATTNGFGGSSSGSHQTTSANNSSKTRKISNYRQISYTVTQACQMTHYANLDGLIAYRESSTANVAIQELVA